MLLRLDEVQRSGESLIVDDFYLLHPVLLGEGRRLQLVLAIPKTQRAVLSLLDPDPSPARSSSGIGRVQDVQHALVVQGQALRDQAGFLPAEDARQVVGRLQRAVSVVFAPVPSYSWDGMSTSPEVTK